MIEERAKTPFEHHRRMPADSPASDQVTPILSLPAARFDLLPETPMPPAGHIAADAPYGDAGHTTPDTHCRHAGHIRTEAHPTNAGAVESLRNGHRTVVSQMTAADLERLHALLGHYARQFFDVQKLRIAQDNRLSAMERDGLDGVWTAPAQSTVDGLDALEKAIDQQLTRLFKQHPLAPWVRAQKGIGLPTMARLLGITGPLSRFGTVSKLWAYLGMHVVDGAAPKRKKGERANWSPQGRVLCYLMGEAIVKVGKDGPYRAAYDRKKAEYETDRPDWPQARRHNAAMRYAVKLLLKEAWIEWRRTSPSDMPTTPRPAEGSVRGLPSNK